MRLAIARIVAPQGVRGEVRALCLTDFPERFAGREVWLGETDKRVRIVAARPHKNVWLLRIDGVDDRNAAEKLRDVVLYTDTDDLAPLPEGTYYVHELIGLPVQTAAGEPVGVIADVLRPGANDVYVVRAHTSPAKEYMIPAVSEFVTVDLPNRRVTVHPIPGLLD